jgi:hypothetical protein
LDLSKVFSNLTLMYHLWYLLCSPEYLFLSYDSNLSFGL